jgi:hypothetical protein
MDCLLLDLCAVAIVLPLHPIYPNRRLLTSCFQVYNRARTSSAEPNPISLKVGKSHAGANDADKALETLTSRSKTRLSRDGEVKVRGSPLRSRSPSPSAGWMSCTVSD